MCIPIKNAWYLLASFITNWTDKAGRNLEHGEVSYRHTKWAWLRNVFWVGLPIYMDLWLILGNRNGSTTHTHTLSLYISISVCLSLTHHLSLSLSRSSVHRILAICMCSISTSILFSFFCPLSFLYEYLENAHSKLLLHLPRWLCLVCYQFWQA